MKLVFTTLTSILISTSGFAARLMHHDPASIHGMLLFGKSQVYLSHLPMFHAPHDYQVLLQATLSAEGLNAYHASLRNSNETVYTLVPEAFSLPELTSHPVPFKAQIYKGHFERGGVLIADNVTVEIKVLYFRKFSGTDVKPSQGTYILFGNSKEQFLAHAITAAPDFDQILKVKTDAKGVAVFNFKDLSNTEPLQASQTLEVTLGETSWPVDIESSLYTEFGDLSF
ncbi:hypothetical protein [uncultured Bdellovibrio sp.]|uniref:hypothetical protein n=1 Tax=Bdellovibrio sp. HCB-162 TaxID=3394234 RepID=UPI0025E59104|nr:hypothetical protein [uncultured Bdellovibrio sp.]